MISSQCETNEEGHKNIFQKAIGAFKHRPNLIKSFFFRGKIYPASFEGESTMVFHYDHDRFVKAMEYMAKAIYFYHFKSKWNEKLNIINTSAVFSPEQPNYMKKNAEYVKLKEMEFGTPKNGENQSIFYYQLLSDKNPSSSVLKMVFYEGFIVFAIPSKASQSLDQT